MEQIAVYGAGTIGSCLATLIIGHGLPCTVVGRSAAELELCRKAVAQNWDDLIAHGLAKEGNKSAALRLLNAVNQPEALSGHTFIFEAVAETPEAKQSVYQAIGRFADPDAVTASCTSSIDADVLAELTPRPEQLLIAHPFQPAHILPLVEVIRHEKTSQAAFDRALALLETLHRQVVVLRRSALSFLVNQLMQALFQEAAYLIGQDATKREEIEQAVQCAVRMRYASMGLLDFFDTAGFGVEEAVAESVYPDLYPMNPIQKTAPDRIAADSGLCGRSEKDAADAHFQRRAAYYDGVKDWPMPQ